MFVTLDFETFYRQGMGLTNLTTEEYINNPEFHEIGVGIKIDAGPTEWVAGHDAIAARLAQIDWDTACVLCHNTLFDGAILAWRFGVVPAFYYDTLCMARAIHGVDAGGSLAALVSRYELGAKGTEVVNALGKRLEDFTPEELARYGEYCKNDVELTFALFNILSYGFPDSELGLIDMTIRMFTCPTLHVDDALLVERLEEVRSEKQELLGGLMRELGCEDEESVRKRLCSNPQFAAILRERGVEVPMKISPATGTETYALAKNDEGFMALQEHEDPTIQQLCAVRLGTKSTLEEARVERFIGIGARNKGKLPIPLKYYGAHTGRWAGMDSVNFQNLPSRDKKKKALKNSIMAPSGHVIVDCDSSQIEARVLAWWAGQDDVVKQFAEGQDVYSEFAAKIYGRPITKANPTERFVGKTCLSDDTQVLTRRGWVRIINVTTSDQLWDGVEWVSHCGVSFMGVKPIINLHGLELTPDHEILTAPTNWEIAQFVQTHGTAFQSALNLAISSLSAISGTHLNEQDAVGDGRLSVDAGVAGVSTPTLGTISEQEDQPHAMSARNERRAISDGGNIKKFCQTISTALDYLTDYPQRFPAAITPTTSIINTTGGAALQFMSRGEQIGLNFYGMFKLLEDGITRRSRLIALMLMGTTNPEISGLFPPHKTPLIKEKLQTLKPVYDILNSGSRNRFTVLTDRGPIIVHNCVLGLGYGTGAKKLKHTLKTTPPGAIVSEEESKRMVDVYRSANSYITALWRECDQALNYMMSGSTKLLKLGLHGIVTVSANGVRLPNGLHIRYKNLRRDGERVIYDSRKGPVSIWGGAMVENIVQALARIIVGQQMLWINREYRVVLTVHDAAMCVVPKEDLTNAVEYITLCMSTTPMWAQGLPIACEAKQGTSYGNCK